MSYRAERNHWKEFATYLSDVVWESHNLSVAPDYKTVVDNVKIELTFGQLRQALASFMMCIDDEVEEAIEDAESELRERARSSLDML